MLNAVLREVRASGGDAAVRAIFERIGKRSAERLAPQPDARLTEQRVTALVASLKAAGVSAALEKRANGKLVLHEHSCPYAAIVAENPEACGAIHSILERVAPGAEHVESLATGGSECRFEIDVDPTSRRETVSAS
jgi:predicted ArsR family transcriptional regulator